MRCKQTKWIYELLIIAIIAVAAICSRCYGKAMDVDKGNLKSAFDASPHSMPNITPLMRQQEANANLDLISGQNAFGRGDLADASVDFQISISLDKVNPDAYYGLAQVETKLGDYSDALRQYSYLFSATKNWTWNSTEEPLIRMHYALLLLKMGDLKAAVSMYNLAIVHMPDNRGAEDYGFYSFTSPDRRDLEASLHAVIGYNIGYDDFQAGIKDETDAEKEFAQAFQLEPNSPLANYYYAEAVRWNGMAREHTDWPAKERGAQIKAEDSQGKLGQDAKKYL